MKQFILVLLMFLCSHVALSQGDIIYNASTGINNRGEMSSYFEMYEKQKYIHVGVGAHISYRFFTPTTSIGLALENRSIFLSTGAGIRLPYRKIKRVHGITFANPDAVGFLLVAAIQKDVVKVTVFRDLLINTSGVMFGVDFY